MTSAHREEEVDDMCGVIEKLIAKQNGMEYIVILGDFNAVVCL